MKSSPVFPISAGQTLLEQVKLVFLVCMFFFGKSRLLGSFSWFSKASVLVRSFFFTVGLVQTSESNDPRWAAVVTEGTPQCRCQQGDFPNRGLDETKGEGSFKGSINDDDDDENENDNEMMISMISMISMFRMFRMFSMIRMIVIPSGYDSQFAMERSSHFIAR